MIFIALIIIAWILSTPVVQDYDIFDDDGEYYYGFPVDDDEFE